MTKSNKNKFFLGAMIGAIGGAVAGILFAPKSGKETRKVIGDKAKEYAKEGKEILDKSGDIARDKIKEYSKESKEILDKGSDIARGKIKEAADTISKKMDK